MRPPIITSKVPGRRQVCEGTGIALEFDAEMEILARGGSWLREKWLSIARSPADGVLCRTKKERHLETQL